MGDFQSQKHLCFNPPTLVGGSLVSHRAALYYNKALPQLCQDACRLDATITQNRYIKSREWPPHRVVGILRRTKKKLYM